MSQGISYWNRKEKSDNMKFNAIVGNPPYQELVASNSGSVSQANPVYNLFVTTATKLTDRYVSMITPSLWMTGGTGLQDFRNYMLKNNHISILCDYEISDSLFKTVNIAGGVSYFLWDKNSIGNTKHVYYKKNGTCITNIVNMAKNGLDIFIRDVTSENILNKIGIFDKKFASFIQLVSTYSPFSNGIVGNYKDFFTQEKNQNRIKIYRFSRERNNKYAYIDREKIIAKQEWIDYHKVYVSKAGEISAKFTGLPFYGEPGSACNETYLVVGPFSTKEVCENVIKYMNTSLYKYLVSQIKKTQNAARGVYKYVPMQNFTNESDIQWSSSKESLDQILFNKYNLTKEEVEYILDYVK